MSGQQDRPGRRGRTRLTLRLTGGGLLIAAGASLPRHPYERTLIQRMEAALTVLD
jgi:hypothetical protein